MSSHIQRSLTLHADEVYGDKAYTDYTVEDALEMLDNVNLNPIRKKNSTRYDEPFVRQYKKMIRRRIETAFSLISSFFVFVNGKVVLTQSV
jgi:hypothetical protein